MELPEPTFRPDPSDWPEEPPCGWCGLRTGGSWRAHVKDCAYVQYMCERYAGIAAFVAGENAPQWERKGPRKNAKH